MYIDLGSSTTTSVMTPTGMLSVPIASLAPLVSGGVRTQAGAGIRTSSLPLLQVGILEVCKSMKLLKHNGTLVPKLGYVSLYY